MSKYNPSVNFLTGHPIVVVRVTVCSKALATVSVVKGVWELLALDAPDALPEEKQPNGPVPVGEKSQPHLFEPATGDLGDAHRQLYLL